MHGISNGGVCATGGALDQPAHVRSLVGGLCLSLECYVTIGLLPGCRLGSELGGGGGGGGCAGFSGSAHVGMPHCRRSHATALDSIIPSFVHLSLKNFRSQDYLIE